MKKFVLLFFSFLLCFFALSAKSLAPPEPDRQLAQHIQVDPTSHEVVNLYYPISDNPLIQHDQALDTPFLSLNSNTDIPDWQDPPGLLYAGFYCISISNWVDLQAATIWNKPDRYVRDSRLGRRKKSRSKSRSSWAIYYT